VLIILLSSFSTQARRYRTLTRCPPAAALYEDALGVAESERAASALSYGMCKFYTTCLVVSQHAFGRAGLFQAVRQTLCYLAPECANIAL